MAKTQVLGLDKFRSGLSVTLATQQRELAAGIEQLAGDLAQEIKANCPSKTGALRDSIKVVAKPGRTASVEILIGSKDVNYAAHVEYGTSHAAARPFVRPTVELFRKKFPGQIEQLIAETWSGK